MHFSLQSLQFPSTEICSKQDLYFKTTAGCVVSMREETCTIPFGGELSFGTYFNSFSIEKWRKYTDLDNLYLSVALSGSVIIRIFAVRMIDGKVFTQVIEEVRDSGETAHKTALKLPLENDARLLYFTITSDSEKAVFLGGEYFTETDPVSLNPVHFGVDICTYRKEAYVLRNIRTLREKIIDNPESPLYDSLDLFISDNGQSLPETAGSGHVRIYKNRNLGGAGGFGRGMVEILQVREELGLTHILMMDDDVLLSHHTLLKTYAFLSLLRPEYRMAFLGGHMLNLNDQTVQSEAADYFNNVAHSPVKHNYDLTDLKYLVLNEIEEPVNHFGWWYCCMPISVVRADNLPLPIFIKRDDIEYGLRNGRIFITLNGINVWHEEFSFKHSSYLDYYYFRNLCILTSIHRPMVSAEEIWNFVRKNVEEKVFTYRYQEAELILLGISDFLKGIDWLKSQDGEALNRRIMALGYKKVRVERLLWKFSYDEYLKSSQKVQPTGRKQRLIDKVTRRGLLLPANRDVAVRSYKPSPGLFYRAKSVLNYEDASGTGFIVYKSLIASRKVEKLLQKTGKEFLSNYRSVSLTYRKRYRELTSLDFWKKYLTQEGEVPEYKSVLPPNRPLSTRGEIVTAAKDYIKLFLQKLLAWVPLDNHRILVTSANRSGFTCNPKYVVQALKQKYGDQADICWVSDYPESCGEIRELGIPVIDRWTRDHFIKSLRAKVYVTNDSFPAWLNHRRDQLWINTWHAAVNYKHIGYEYLVPKSIAEDKNYRLQNRQPDIYLAGSGQFLEDTSRSFHFDPGIFIKTGLPRNDIFFRNNSELRRKIAQRYNIPEDSRILLYAPTFRQYITNSTYGLDFQKLKASLEKRFSGNWVMFFRSHHFIHTEDDAVENVISVTDYPDMNELLAAADILISDYSSCLYDFALQMKPCFVYAPDLAQYRDDDRGFAIPVSEWPYSIAQSNDELSANIEGFDESTYRERLEEHFRAVDRYDQGNASEQAADLIAKFCGFSGSAG